jgi:hypothetical protein
MGSLLLDNDLRSAKEGDETYQLARARTFTTLGRVDSNHKRDIVRFLHEAGLISTTEASKSPPVVSLADADLSGVDE